MTARVEAGAQRIAVGPQPRRAIAGLPRLAAALLTALLAALLAVLKHLARDRPPDAARLTDRQLADIGLARSDLPDHRGWRR